MIASLPMYDWQQVRAQTDRLWQAIRAAMAREGLAAPAALDRAAGLWEVWQSPGLVLSQTCGLPYRTRLRETVSLIGTPDYALEGAAPGQYYSVLVVRAGRAGGFEDFTGGVLACNGFDSQSGWAAPQTHAEARGLSFTRAVLTGAHRASAQAVAEGRADIAAIDAVTWRLIEAHLPDVARGLRVLEHTAPTSGLPLIAAATADAPASFRAVAAAIADLGDADRRALGLQGLVAIPPEAYAAIPTPPPIAQIAQAR